MMQRSPWVKLPNAWIEEGRLKEFRWKQTEGANNVAALMVLAAAAHHMRPQDGIAHLTYTQLCTMTSLSRAKVAAGLSVLESKKLLARAPEGRSSLQICNYNPDSGWAKFPSRGLYRNGIIYAFKDFRLRLPAELEAMKLYYLFASRRDRQTNSANITYTGIEEYTGISSQNIRRGLSILSSIGLIHVDQMPSTVSEYGVSNMYRLPHIKSRQHRGTSGRGIDATAEFESLQ